MAGCRWQAGIPLLYGVPEQRLADGGCISL